MFDFVIPVGCPNRVPFSTYKIHFQVSFSHLKCVIFHFLRNLLNIPAKFKLAQLKTFTAIGKFEGWLGVKTFIFSVYKCTVYQFYWAREVTLSPVVVEPFTSTWGKHMSSCFLNRVQYSNDSLDCGIPGKYSVPQKISIPFKGGKSTVELV